MFEKIKFVFENNKDIKNKYLIDNLEDLYNDKKINFYFILIKYIIKDLKFIYQINFLLKLKNNILKIFKSNPNKIISNNIKNNNIKRRLENLLIFFLESDFYIEKYLKLNININNNKLSESPLRKNKKKDNNEEKNKDDDKEKKIDHEIEFNNLNNTVTTNLALTSNNKLTISNIENQENNNNIIKINRIDKSESENIVTKKNNNKKSNYISNSNLNNGTIQTKKEYLEQSSISSESENNSSNFNNIPSVNYYSKSQYSNIKNENKTYSNNINIIESYSDLKDKKTNIDEIKFDYILKFSKILNEKEEKEEKKSKNDDKNKKSIQQNTFDFIFEFNECLITKGTNKSLYFYEKYNKISEINYKNDSPYLVLKIDEDKNKDKDKINILICYRNKNSKYEYEKNDKIITWRLDYSYSENVIFFLKDNNNVFMCLEKKIVLLTNYFDNNLIYKENKDIQNIFIKSIIKVDDYLLILKSNKIVSKGKDKLIFFNCKTGKEVKINIKEDYSFVFTINGLAVIPIKNEENNSYNKQKVILCACKQYSKNQKNGILFISFEIKYNTNSIKLNYKFEDTGNFEVYCFCPLLLYEHSKTNILEKDIIKIETDYFLVGGFDIKRKKGMIKLYRVNYGKKYDNTKIEYIQDLIVNDNKIKFKGPISCIIQTIYDGKILINCWDGNVYLLKYPQIKKYLEYDEKVKKFLNKYK